MGLGSGEDDLSAKVKDRLDHVYFKIAGLVSDRHKVTFWWRDPLSTRSPARPAESIAMCIVAC
jgi:hypothetical protein